jgi:leucyl-tRNA synthetase
MTSDFAFAIKYGLEVIEAIDTPAEFKDADGKLTAYPGDGVLVNSGEFNDCQGRRHRHATEWLRKEGADSAVNSLRDWLVSRQR